MRVKHIKQKQTIFYLILVCTIMSLVSPFSIYSQEVYSKKLEEIKNFLKENENKINGQPIIPFEMAIKKKDKESLIKIYKDKNSGIFRLLAFEELTSGVETALEGEEPSKLLAEGKVDPDSKIRITVYLMMEGMDSPMGLPNPVEVDDIVVKRFLTYMKYLEDEETLMKASAAFEDDDPGIRFMFVRFLCIGYGMGGQKELLPLIAEGLNNDDALIRIFTSLNFMNDDRYKAEACQIFAQSLEEFIKANEEGVIYIILKDGWLPLAAFPNRYILENIFNDKRPLVRYTIVELLRKSIYPPKPLIPRR